MKTAADNTGATVPPAVTTGPAAVAAAPAPQTSASKWDTVIGIFATAVGKTAVEVTEALKPVVGDPNDEGLALLADPASTPDVDLKAALASLKIPSGKINQNIAKLRGESIKVNTVSAGVQALAILPQVPDNKSFIELLKVGGVLKVGPAEVICAVRAGIARRVGLFEIPDKILSAMDKFLDAQDEPASASYFTVQKLLTTRTYGDVLAAIGVPGKFVSEARKRAFLAKVDSSLWPALASFQNTLASWQSAWLQGAMGPGLALAVMAAGSAGAGLPAGMMMAPPDTGPVRASGETVLDVINKVFAGPGIPVARALAYDATCIQDVLEDPAVPQQIGAATKDQMLRELGVSVGSELVRAEQSLARYALAIMSLKDVSAEAELNYLSAMIQLGSTIPWEKIVASSAGIGRSRGGE